MLRNLPVDATRLGLISTGHVTARAVWAELSDGSRRPVPGKQAVNEDGTPLWTIGALAPTAERPEVIEIEVASHDEPKVQQFGPLYLEGLEVRVSKSRNGELRQYWSALKIDGKGGRPAPANP